MEKQIDFTAMSLDDIIFINRNKEYGAYQLRQSYNQNVKRAIVGMIFFSTSLVGYQNLLAMWHPHSPMKTIETVCNVSKIQTKEIKPPSVPPTEQKTEQIKKGKPNAATTALLEKKAVKDKNATTDSIAPVDHRPDIADNVSPGTAGEAAGSETGTAPADIPKTEAANNGEPVICAEKMPEYPGGEKALLSFIRDHLRYPQYESEMGIHGKAVIGFVIDEKGKVTDVSVVRGVSKGLDRESIRVIKMLNDFTPGMQSGRAVKVRYVIPIDFNLAAD